MVFQRVEKNTVLSGTFQSHSPISLPSMAKRQRSSAACSNNSSCLAWLMSRQLPTSSVLPVNGLRLSVARSSIQR